MLCYIALVAICIYEIIAHLVAHLLARPLPADTHVYTQSNRANIPSFKPALRTPVLQTLVSFIMSSVPPRGVRWTFECFKRGSQIVGFWWYSPFVTQQTETPVVVCAAGMNGGYQSHYVNQLAAMCKARGMVCVVLDKSDVDIGSTWELEALVDELAASHTNIMVLGVSAGGNGVCRYAARSDIPPAVRACVSVSNGMDIATAKASIRYPWAHIMMPLYRSFMMKKTGIPIRAFRRAQTIWDIDDVVFGHPDERFYVERSSHEFVKNARVPLVVVNALDDPFFDNRVSEHAREASRLNPLVTMVTTDCGGHMGWFQGRNRGASGSWFFDDMLPAVCDMYVGA